MLKFTLVFFPEATEASLDVGVSTYITSFLEFSFDWLSTVGLGFL